MLEPSLLTRAENEGVENRESYVTLLSMAGNTDGWWLCESGEAEGVCPCCGEKAVESGESVIMDWEGNGVMTYRYASYCGCGRSWVEEAPLGSSVDQGAI
jgi:hypothetical protein